LPPTPSQATEFNALARRNAHGTTWIERVIDGPEGEIEPPRRAQSYFGNNSVTPRNLEKLLPSESDI
jgi:hypothetical protein